MSLRAFWSEKSSLFFLFLFLFFGVVLSLAISRASIARKPR